MTEKPSKAAAKPQPKMWRDAPHGRIDPGEIAIGVVIGRVSEFFDFFVYAIASVLVFPKLVFSFMDPLTATLSTFAIFAIGFVARPLGTIIFTTVERNWGRSSKMIGALFLLGTSTVAVAFLPAYADIGPLAIFLLAICRLGQGLAWGGSWDGLPSLLAMNAPPHRLGWYTMIPQLGAMIGLFIATTLFIYFVTHLSAADFLDWGWRYPFFVAFAINVVALFARLRIVSTPQYTELFERRELYPAQVAETFVTQRRNVLLGAFTPLASLSLFHMVTVFPLSWVFLFTEQNPSRFLVIEAFGALIGAACVIGSGIAAEMIGRRMLLGITAAVIGAFSGFAPQLLNGGALGEMFYIGIGFALLGFSFGQSSGVMASNFPPSYRYTGSAITTDLAWLFGAGFAPITALWLSSRFGLPSAGVYLLSGAAGTAIALLLNKRMAKSL